MTRKDTKWSKSIFVFALAPFVASTLVAGGQSFSLNATQVTILIPSQMRFIQVTPTELRTTKEMSVLSYRVLIVGSEPVGGLHWKLFITNDKNEIVKESDWWDRGNWNGSSLIKSKTVFEYNEKSRHRITLLLSEVDTETRFIAVDSALMEQHLRKILKTNNVEGLSVSSVTHAVISAEDESNLVTTSLETILKNSQIREMLLLNHESSDIFLLETKIDIGKEVTLKPVTSKQIQESIKKQEPISYFEYGWIESLGPSVTVVLNYHMPKVYGNGYIDQGVRLETLYSKVGSDYKFKGLRTLHF